MDQKIRVLIADDNLSARKGVKALLDEFPQIDVIEQAINGNQAVELAEAFKPDVILMDVHMPVLNGLQAIRNIKSNWPDINVVVLTIDRLSRTEALAAGASEFLVKGCSPDAIQQAIFRAKDQSLPQVE